MEHHAVLICTPFLHVACKSYKVGELVEVFVNLPTLFGLVADLRLHNPRRDLQGGGFLHGHERPRHPSRGPRWHQGFLLESFCLA